MNKAAVILGLLGLLGGAGSVAYIAAEKSVPGKETTALTGQVKTYRLKINGSMVSRDDALEASNWFIVNHDIHILNALPKNLGLPFSIKRPKLVSWQECPAAGCPP